MGCELGRWLDDDLHAVHPVVDAGAAVWPFTLEVLADGAVDPDRPEHGGQRRRWSHAEGAAADDRAIALVNQLVVTGRQRRLRDQQLMAIALGAEREGYWRACPVEQSNPVGEGSVVGIDGVVHEPWRVRGDGRHWRRRRIAGGKTSAHPRSEETRLNSSHLVISYAVFCLKKKTDK